MTWTCHESPGHPPARGSPWSCARPRAHLGGRGTPDTRLRHSPLASPPPVGATRFDPGSSEGDRGSCPPTHGPRARPRGLRSPHPGQRDGARRWSRGHQVAEEAAAKRNGRGSGVLRGHPWSVHPPAGDRDPGRALCPLPRDSLAGKEEDPVCSRLPSDGAGWGGVWAGVGGYGWQASSGMLWVATPFLGTTWAHSPPSQSLNLPGMRPQVPQGLSQPRRLLVCRTPDPMEPGVGGGRSSLQARAPPSSPPSPPPSSPSAPISPPVCLVTARGRPSWGWRSAAQMTPSAGYKRPRVPLTACRAPERTSPANWEARGAHASHFQPSGAWPEVMDVTPLVPPNTSQPLP